MYASEVVETASAHDVFQRPLHPYTEALIASIPTVTGRREKLEVIPGQVPSPLSYPAGCRFRDRCKYAFAHCAGEHPPLRKMGQRAARCFLAQERLNSKS
jgi:oligopeptide/dipeptide ABC transporter ATP-binding protein